MIGSFFVRCGCLLVLLMASDAMAVHQDTAPTRRESMAALRDITRELTAEAQEARSAGFLRHTQPNAADRSDHSINPPELQRALTERQHRDPFIDAYIRWQLTSYDVDLPTMSAPQFGRFMEQTPAMIDNPRGSQQAIALFTRASEAGALSPTDLSQLREANRELDRQAQTASALNVPAVEFRAWVLQQLGDAGPLRLLWMLENCAAAVNSAWPPASIKRQISQAFSASTEDDSLTSDDRQTIAQQVQRLAGLERQFINEVTFMADNTVRVSMSTAAITTRDVNNWLGRLAGE